MQARPSPLSRIARRGLAGAALLALAVAAAWWAARPATPDNFYRMALPRDAAPGTLLRQEPFGRGLPPGTKGWRILYTTTRFDDTAALASAIVLAPSKASAAPRPVIAWAHGTTGVARGCAPSLMEDPFANVPAVERIAGEDWLYVATDYVGLGTGGHHAYLVGDDAARAVLDSVRAARGIEGLAPDNRVVVWGHSQGGNAALWAGIRAADYAPDVTVLGIAAQAPASDLPALFSSGKGSMFGKIVSSYVVKSYADTYPGVRVLSPVRWEAALIAEDIASRCVGERATLFSVAETVLLPRGGIFTGEPREGALGQRLAANTPAGPIPAPVFIAQGEADDLVLPQVQANYVAARCAAGQAIDYRAYAGQDHVSLVAKDSPLGADLVEWTRDRFAGKPARNSCVR